MQGWTSSSRGDIDSPVRMVSLDCEMVVCEDDEKEVVRVCAVGSDCQVCTYWSMQFQNVTNAIPLFALTPFPVVIVHTIQLSRMV